MLSSKSNISFDVLSKSRQLNGENFAAIIKLYGLKYLMRRLARLFIAICLPKIFATPSSYSCLLIVNVGRYQHGLNNANSSLKYPMSVTKSLIILLLCL